MLDVGYELNIKEFKVEEIGSDTLVRSRYASLRLTLTNNSQNNLFKLNVRPVLESYVGQPDAQLFQWLDTKIIEKIPSRNMVPLEFLIKPLFPGLVSVAIYMTDAANNVPMAKRTSETNYQQAPVRWWFHVVDNISVQTLRAIQALEEKKRVVRKK